MATVGVAGSELVPHEGPAARIDIGQLAGCLVPVNADVPALDASFVEEHDPYASTIGARGIGEVGAVGVSAAIANAVHHATGVRVRDLPITPDALLEPLR